RVPNIRSPLVLETQLDFSAAARERLIIDVRIDGREPADLGSQRDLLGAGQGREDVREVSAVIEQLLLSCQDVCASHSSEVEAKVLIPVVDAWHAPTSFPLEIAAYAKSVDRDLDERIGLVAPTIHRSRCQTGIERLEQRRLTRRIRSNQNR